MLQLASIQDINNSFRCLQHAKHRQYISINFDHCQSCKFFLIFFLSIGIVWINYRAISIESHEHSMLSDDRKFKVIYKKIPLYMIISLLGCMQCNHHVLVTETPLMIGSMKNGRYFIGEGMWCNWSIFWRYRNNGVCNPGRDQ